MQADNGCAWHRTKTVVHLATGATILDVVVAHIKANSPVSGVVEGRIWNCEGQYNTHTGPQHGSCGGTTKAGFEDLPQVDGMKELSIGVCAPEASRAHPQGTWQEGFDKGGVSICSRAGTVQGRR